MFWKAAFNQNTGESIVMRLDTSLKRVYFRDFGGGHQVGKQMEDLGKLATSLHLFSLSQTSGQVFMLPPVTPLHRHLNITLRLQFSEIQPGLSIDRVMNCTLDFLGNQLLMSYVWAATVYEAPLSLKSSFKSIWSSLGCFNWILLKENVEITSGLCWFTSVAFKKALCADWIIWRGCWFFSLKSCPYDVI